jgi:hypothetical protein
MHERYQGDNMSRRQRSNANEVVVIYWRDIPAQVTASVGGERQKMLLADRFQHAIDRAAAVAGLTETQAYLSEWRQVTRPIGGEMAQAQAAAAQLEDDYPQVRLEALVTAGGVDPVPTQPQPPPVAVMAVDEPSAQEETS